MEDFAPPVGPYPKASSHMAHTSDGSQENYWNHTYTAPAPTAGASGDPTPDQVYQYYGQYYDYSGQYGNYYYYQDPYGQHQRSQKQLACEVCNRSFFSEAKLQQHIEGHVKCPFPECGLEADMKIIDQHITNQHMLVNFEALQMDDEAWIAERKKRFPTAERAAIRRAQQEQQLKRGERLQPNKKRFNKDAKSISKPKSVDKKRPPNNDSSDMEQNRGRGRGKRGNCRKEENKNKFSRSAPLVDIDPYDSDPEVKRGVPAFKGTKQYYESTGEVSYFVNYSRKVTEEDEYMSEENMEDGLCISDEEEWQSVQILKDTEPTPSDSTKIVLGNALGSLIGAYYSDSEEGENTESHSAQPGVDAKEVVKQSTSAPISCTQKEVGEVVKSDEGSLKSKENKGEYKRRRRGRRRGPAKGKGSENSDRGNTNQSRPRPKQPRFPRRRKATLLEKLLESDIRHERNVILQCIRYIVNNNFFDSPEETVAEVEGKRDDGKQSSKNSVKSATENLMEWEERKEKDLDKENGEASTTNILESENDIEDRLALDNQERKSRVELADNDHLECENRKEESLDHNSLEVKTRILLENKDNAESRMEVDHPNRKDSIELATVDQMECKNGKEKLCDQDHLEGKTALKSEDDVNRVEFSNQNENDSVESVTIDQMEHENGKDKNCDQDNVRGKAVVLLESENITGDRFEMCNQIRKDILESGTKEQLACEDKKEKSLGQNHVGPEIANLFRSENGVEDKIEVDDCNQIKKGALESITKDQLECEKRKEISLVDGEA